MVRKAPADLTRTPSPVTTGLRVFGNKPFIRFARKFGASDQDLCDALQEDPDADLGGGVFKFRLAREGGGKSAGARSIVAMKKGQRIVMMFGFEKKNLSNIDDKELKAFKKLAKVYLSGSEQQMDALVKAGELTEIKAGHTKESLGTK